jgi:hypothetical protein
MYTDKLPIGNSCGCKRNTGTFPGPLNLINIIEQLTEEKLFTINVQCTEIIALLHINYQLVINDNKQIL